LRLQAGLEKHNLTTHFYMKNRKQTKIVSSVLLGVLVLVLSVLKSDGANYIHDGVEAAKAGDWDKAIENFKKAAESDPNDKNVNHNLGLAYSQRGLAEIKKQNWDGSIADLGEALQRNEGDVVARRFRAFAYTRKGNWKEALQDYDTVLKQKKNDPEALSHRAFVYVQLGQTDKALADYSSMLKGQPKDIDALLGRTYIYETTGKLDLGLADVNAVLKQKPNNQEALNRKIRLEAMARKLHPTPVPTPVLAGTPIPRASIAPKPKPSPKSSATPSPH